MYSLGGFWVFNCTTVCPLCNMERVEHTIHSLSSSAPAGSSGELLVSLVCSVFSSESSPSNPPVSHATSQHICLPQALRGSTMRSIWGWKISQIFLFLHATSGGCQCEKVKLLVITVVPSTCAVGGYSPGQRQRLSPLCVHSRGSQVFPGGLSVPQCSGGWVNRLWEPQKPTLLSRGRMTSDRPSHPVLGGD